MKRNSGTTDSSVKNPNSPPHPPLPHIGGGSAMQKLKFLQRPKQFLFFVLWAIVACAGAYLILTGLGRPVLWGDEAETALMSETTLAKGYPSSFDGRRIFTIYDDMRESNKRFIWTFHPWLQFYAAAGSMAVFGHNAKAARLPFALASWLSLFAMGAFAYKWLRFDRINPLAVSLLPAVIALSNPVFINHARQARYYGLVLLFVPVCMHLYMLWHSAPDRRKAAALGICLALLFHSNYFHFGLLTAAMILHLLISGRNKIRTGFPTFLLALASAFILSYPWYAVFKPYPGGIRLAAGRAWLDYIITMAKHANNYALPLILPLTAFIVCFTAGRFRARDKNKLPDLPARRFIWMVFLIVIAGVACLPIYTFRYLLPILACGAFIAADAVAALWLKSRIAAVSAFIMLVCTGVLQNAASPRQFFSAQTWRLPLADVIYEKTRRPPTMLNCVVDFLALNSKPEETILVEDPAFQFSFHTGMKVLDARFRYNLAQAASADWIMELATIQLGMPKIRLLPASLGLTDKYEKIQFGCPETPPWGVIPEPGVHDYGRNPYRLWPVVFYKKI